MSVIIVCLGDGTDSQNKLQRLLSVIFSEKMITREVAYTKLKELDLEDDAIAELLQ